MSANLDFAYTYCSLGWMPIPIPKGTKNPGFKGWQNFRVSETELSRHFNNGSNIGLLLGEPSGGLIDIDLDCPFARALAAEILPQTPMIGGRSGALRSHFWYICDPLPVTTRYADPSPSDINDRATLIEIRSTGAQTVVPPSIHPSGERYEWYGDLSPTRVKNNDLQRKVEKLAACALLARHWQTGQRYYTAMALAGWLLRSGWSDNRAENFIRLAAGAAGDEEVSERLQAVFHTLRRLNNGQAATGQPTLEKLIGEKVVACLREWLQLDWSHVLDPAIVSSSQSGVEDAWPDPEPLPVGLLPVPQMPEDLLPEPFRPWLSDIAERMQCPLEFPTVGAMVALSSVIGDKLAIRPKRHDDWSVYPNFWGAIVGRPGVLKSPALDEATKPLRRLEIAARGQYEQALKAWEFDRLQIEAEKKSLREKILKAVKQHKVEELQSLRAQMECAQENKGPVQRRYIVNDSTVEKLGELLNQNPHGLLLFRDELVGWLKTLDREGHEGDRAFYLESWNGHGSFTYDRIGRGTLHINSVTLSILGGIQPGPLSQYLRGALAGGASDDGLLQRFQLLVYPDIAGDWHNFDRYPNTSAKNQAYEVFKKISDLSGKDVCAIEEDGYVPYVRFDDEAQELFNQWRAELEADLRTGKARHSALEAHLSKYRSLMPSLALIFHLLDQATDRATQSAIPLEATARAAGWCTFLFKHAERVYGMALDSTAHLAKSLADHIRQSDLPNPFTARDVYLKHWSGLAAIKDVTAPLDLLVDLNWLREVTIQTGGRPKQYYYTNPKIVGEGR